MLAAAFVACAWPNAAPSRAEIHPRSDSALALILRMALEFPAARIVEPVLPADSPARTSLTAAPHDGPVRRVGRAPARPCGAGGRRAGKVASATCPMLPTAGMISRLDHPAVIARCVAGRFFGRCSSPKRSHRSAMVGASRPVREEVRRAGPRPGSILRLRPRPVPRARRRGSESASRRWSGRRSRPAASNCGRVRTNALAPARQRRGSRQPGVRRRSCPAGVRRAS